METQKIMITQHQLKVIRTITKKETREALQNIKIDKDNIVCTNGRILIVIKHGQDYKQGAWRIIGEEKSAITHRMLTLERSDLEFPDYTNVMPAQTKESIKILLEDEYSVSRSMFDLEKFTGSTFCYTILNTFAPFKLSWTAYKADKDKAVLLVCDEDMQAIVLPFRK